MQKEHCWRFKFKADSFTLFTWYKREKVNRMSHLNSKAISSLGIILYFKYSNHSFIRARYLLIFCLQFSRDRSCVKVPLSASAVLCVCLGSLPALIWNIDRYVSPWRYWWQMLSYETAAASVCHNASKQLQKKNPDTLLSPALRGTYSLPTLLCIAVQLLVNLISANHMAGKSVHLVM